MTLAPGTRLGLYEVLSPLGAGAMGEVYRAREARQGRDVALKVLQDRLRRFEQEAPAIGALNHPNLLALFDVGTTPMVLLSGSGDRRADRLFAEGRRVVTLRRSVVGRADRLHTGGNRAIAELRTDCPARLQAWLSPPV
jgi:hypothetical protein